MHEDSTQEEEMRKQKKNEGNERYDEENQIERKDGC